MAMRPVNEVAKLAVMGHVNIFCCFFVVRTFFFKESFFNYYFNLYGSDGPPFTSPSKF